MQFYTCLPAVLAYGAVSELRKQGRKAELGWPSSIVLDGECVAVIEVHAGFREGLYADAAVVVLSEQHHQELEALHDELATALISVTEMWEHALRNAANVAGPLAPILGDYFDVLSCAGEMVRVLYPNGNLAARGVLAGIDVWGRATVKTINGRELELAPEQVRIERDNA